MNDDFLKEYYCYPAYPEEVQERIDRLKDYKENNKLIMFNVVHMYPKNLAYPNGYTDSRFFECFIYNTETMEFKNLGRHDGIRFNGNVSLYSMVIFADGSTCIRFDNLLYVEAPYTQCLFFEGIV